MFHIEPTIVVGLMGSDTVTATFLRQFTQWTNDMILIPDWDKMHFLGLPLNNFETQR
jgi:hypothetical protein